MALGKLVSYMRKKKERKKLDSCLTPYIKINSKEKNDSNIRAKIIKDLEEYIGVNLHDLGFGNRFLDMTLKAQAIKEKLISWLSSKFKAFMLQTVPLRN